VLWELLWERRLSAQGFNSTTRTQAGQGELLSLKVKRVESSAGKSSEGQAGVRRAVPVLCSYLCLCGYRIPRVNAGWMLAGWLPSLVRTNNCLHPD
jgi:hypothetical protein